MKQCRFCGQMIEDKAKFCKYCGNKADIVQQTKDSGSQEEKYNQPGKINGSIKNNKILFLVGGMICIVLITFLVIKSGMFTSSNSSDNTVVNSDSSSVIQNETSNYDNTAESNQNNVQAKTKYDVLNEVAYAAKNYYVTYLNASNSKDKYLIENCTEELREDRGEHMKVNEEYEFYNRKFIFDIGSLEYITEGGQEKAIFKIKAENDGYRYNDSSYVDNVICLHIEAIKENGEWLMYFVNKIDPSLLSENVFEVE